MKRVGARTLFVAVLAGCALYPALVTRMTAPSNWGGHGLTNGFGRGRLDLQGIVSEGAGGSIELPNEPLVLTLKLSGEGVIHLRGDGVEQAVAGSAAPLSVRLDLPRGGAVSVESLSRIRLLEIGIERVLTPWFSSGVAALFALLAVLVAMRRSAATAAVLALLIPAFGMLLPATLSQTFARIAFAKLLPAFTILILVLPLVLALREARFPRLREVTPLARLSFVASLGLSGLQLLLFDQPLPLGDPGAYFEMGGRFAEAISRLGSPLALGPILSEVQPYLALPATGVLYGLLRYLNDGLGLIYAIQALAMAASIAAAVSICETEVGPRAAKLALALSLLHPSFLILPGIVQPEPFILAAWTMACVLALHALRGGGEPRTLLGAGVLLGIGLALHPQGLSFLLLAFFICLLPWSASLIRRPARIVAPLLGVFSVLLPAAAAEHFSKPLAHVLDRQFGFFAYTSPHPLGFWLYVDSDGWQGPLRIEDTTYQKELIAMKGEGAVASTFADVTASAFRHPQQSAQTVLRNLHRLWQQPDNPFAVPFVLPYSLQIPLHRGLVVLFVLSLPVLLSGRLAILALPFVMLSMTYPAYHVFNKYATPALPFTIIGAALALDRLWNERVSARLLGGALTAAAIGALFPASLAARLGIHGDLFLSGVRGLLWVGLGIAVMVATRRWASDLRPRMLSVAIGVIVLIVSSVAASRTDTTRGSWSVALEAPFEASCRIPAEPAGSESVARDPAWLLLDLQTDDGRPPSVTVNGQALATPVPAMPTYGLATLRGRREPATLRQMWRTAVDDALLAAGELEVRVTGAANTRLFGDIRSGQNGPRLSVGNWPYLSVYRLMHEGQYRLPTWTAPAQGCVASGISGRPGLALVRIAAGDEDRIALKAAKPLTWIF